MSRIIDNINSADDVKKLNNKQKIELAQEIRDCIIDTVSKNGGHLASNLGVVELTIALHSVFDVPKDKIVWDVGHQTYVHKIITGRKDKINTIRKLNGIAGFPKINESECDCFNTGHSSTSISVALGMAKSRDIKNVKNSVIAVIGDGALTGGMALEALNNAASLKTNIIVILNDNQMSISKNVGSISMCLSKLRTKKLYTKSNKYVKSAMGKMPRVGKRFILFTRKIKYSIKQLILPNMIFEDLGFKYLGPVYGHNIRKLEDILRKAKRLDGPVLIHVMTKKGKGYKPAEDNPDKFHSSSPFNIETGESLKEKKVDYSKVMGEKLVKLAEEDDKIVAITAAMKDGTGLTRFAKLFPERFFDVGIAEQHALGVAAGLASQGLKPVVPIYSSFYQRAYDQVIHDICIQNLPVVLCVDRAGLVGNDGETHQGIYDLSFFNIVPNLTIMAPKNFKELEDMLEFGVNLNSPVVIRYPRGGEGSNDLSSNSKIELGKAEILQDGQDVSIIAIGKMVDKGMEVLNILKEQGINAELINARFLKPIDEDTIINSITKTKKVVTIEDNIVEGGLGSKVEELIIKHSLKDVKIIKIGFPDKFIQHGTIDELEKIYGLDVENIVKEINILKDVEVC